MSSDLDATLRDSAFQEHLPHELDMLEYTFAVVHQGKNAEALALHPPIRNALIEAFWLHARNLLEFFRHPENKNGVLPRATVSAKDFTTDFASNQNMDEIIDRINLAVTHLQYGRPSHSNDKLHGLEMAQVKDMIDREFRRFKQALKPEYDRVWKRRTTMDAWSIQSPPVLSSTSTISSSTLTINYSKQ